MCSFVKASVLYLQCSFSTNFYVFNDHFAKMSAYLSLLLTTVTKYTDFGQMQTVFVKIMVFLIVVNYS